MGPKQRMSAINIGMPFRAYVSYPDGNLDNLDRKASLNYYSFDPRTIVEILDTVSFILYIKNALSNINYISREKSSVGYIDQIDQKENLL